jgi:CcmD family protein
MLKVSTLMHFVRGIYCGGRLIPLVGAVLVGGVLVGAVSAITLSASNGQIAAQQPTAQQTATLQPAAPGSPAAAARQQQPARPRASQDEFVPVADLPDSEKLPAAPFLITAYTIVWLVLLGYVWSLWRRLTQVEQELKRAVADETRHA